MRVLHRDPAPLPCCCSLLYVGGNFGSPRTNVPQTKCDAWMVTQRILCASQVLVITSVNSLGCFESQKLQKACCGSSVALSYRLGKCTLIIDVRPSRSIVFPTHMSTRLRSLRPQALTLARCVNPSRNIAVGARHLSLFTRPAPTYDEHVPLTPVGRLGLAISSGVGAFLDPRKGGMCSSSLG